MINLNYILCRIEKEDSLAFLPVKQLRLVTWDTQYVFLALYRYDSPYNIMAFKKTFAFSFILDTKMEKFFSQSDIFFIY